MIKTFAIAVLENTLNRFINLDPPTLASLRKLSGKIILLEISNFPLSCYLLITESGLQVLQNYDDQPDTTIKGSSIELFKQLNKQAHAAIIVEGDMELGQKFRDILHGMEIDWEEQISKYTGDVIANQIGNTMRKLQQWTKDVHGNLRQDVTDYLQEEANLLPTRAEIKIFLDDVSGLRDDVERLQKKFEM